jgi:adenosylhomocysteine nucleosidase
MFNKSKTIILVALEDELPKKYLPTWNIIYSGVGKVNAAYSLSKAIHEFEPSTVINFGTAGTLSSNLNGLHEVSVFKQRDMDAVGLGFVLGETPFDEISTIDNKRKGLSCGTGDSFVNTKPKLLTDLVDMEAYALAKVCKLSQIEFICYKYISDNANDDANNAWNENLTNGALAFSNLLS